MVIFNEIEYGAPPSDNLVAIGGYISNNSYFGWDSRNGSVLGTDYTVNVHLTGWSTGPWTHYAVVGTGTQYKFFINGVLRSTQTPVSGAYLTVLDSFEFVTGPVGHANCGIIREICVWTGERYTSDFSAQYDPNLRWNGMMLT